MNIAERFGVSPPSPVVTSKMINAARKSVTLLVEAGFDQRFWRMHTHESCRVSHVGQGGREAVLHQLDEARTHPDAHLLGVLDADLDRMEARLVLRADVVWTDAHDLETTLLGLPVLERLAHQRVGADVLAQMERAWGETLRVRLFGHALGLGRLRWLKQRQQDLEDLRFKKQGKGSRKGELLHFDAYGDCAGKDWRPDLDQAIAAVLAYSNANHLRPPRRDLQQEARGLPDAPVAQICNGHDLMGFLHDWLASHGSPKFSDTADLAEAVALACERGWVETTEMWQALRAWEQEHPGYPVLVATPAPQGR